MIVRNILVNKSEEIIDLLVRYLIKYGISYVLIDNEIHFDNYIFKFYNIEDYATKLRKIQLTMEDFEVEREEFQPTMEDFGVEREEFQSTNKYRGEKNIPKLNKKLIKANNRFINNKIKRKK